MSTLGDFPSLVVPEEQDRTSFQNEFGAFLDGNDSDWVVFVDSGIDVFPRTWRITPEPLLCAAGTSLRLLARNAITGLASTHGVLLCQRALVLRNGGLPEADAVLPVLAGEWQPVSAQEAFLGGLHHAATSPATAAPDTTSERRLTYEASMGADHPFGPWWMLGVCTGYIETAEAGAVWAAVADLEDKPAALDLAVQDAARRVRQRHGLQVVPMSPEASRWARQGTCDWPSRPVWEAFADYCEGLGGEGKRLAIAYRAAGRRIWGVYGAAPHAAAARVA